MIRIVARPEGEAPESVRAAWIGLELPVSYPAQVEALGFGVLTGPKSPWMQRLKVFLGQAQRTTGYIVPADQAIERLAGKDPAAAKWWRDNAPHFLVPEASFIFDARACELLDR